MVRHGLHQRSCENARENAQRRRVIAHLRAMSWKLVTQLHGWTPLRNRAIRRATRAALPSDELIVAVSCRRDVQHFLDTGRLTAESIARSLFAADRPLPTYSSVLDFGSGCGRVVRHLMTASNAMMSATDIHHDAIAWLCQYSPTITAKMCGLAPPLPFADSEFDLIYSVSVFTHLPFELQMQWMHELHRTLRPGGVLLLTTQGDGFSHQLSARERARFNAGQLVVRNQTLAGSNVCDVYHPTAWVTRELAAVLPVLIHAPSADRGYPGQDHWLFQKPALESRQP
jgi:SAM-dependent methyltransferase